MDQDKTYRFITDPGHGWLEVTMEEIEELRIAGKISTCSYRRGNIVYLEEDLDAGIFIKAYEVQFGKRPSYREVYQEKCQIRDYPPYHS